MNILGRHPLSLLLVAVSIFFVQVPRAEADAIGQGYFCTGTTILNKRNKSVKLRVAKEAIQNKISALGNSKRDKAKKATLKQVKANLVACAGGTFFPGDIGGTYTGTLTRTSSKGSSSLCDYDAAVNGSFVVAVNGTTVSVSGSNPFHILVSGKRSGNSYKLSGTSGSAYRKSLDLVLSNVSDNSGDFTAVRTGIAFNPLKRKFMAVCEVHFAGTGFTRVR